MDKNDRTTSGAAWAKGGGTIMKDLKSQAGQQSQSQSQAT